MRAFTTRSATLCVTVPVVFVFMIGSAGVASAEELNVQVERPVMYFSFDPDPLQHTICGNGFLREPPSPNPLWTLEVYGTRSIPTLITGSKSVGTQSAFVCLTVDKLGAVQGEYAATFRYQATPSDPPSQIVAHATWFPGTNGEIVVTEQ